MQDLIGLYHLVRGHVGLETLTFPSHFLTKGLKY